MQIGLSQIVAAVASREPTEMDADTAEFAFESSGGRLKIRELTAVSSLLTSLFLFFFLFLPSLFPSSLFGFPRVPREMKVHLDNAGVGEPLMVGDVTRNRAGVLDIVRQPFFFSTTPVSFLRAIATHVRNESRARRQTGRPGKRIVDVSGCVSAREPRDRFAS